MSVLEVTKPFSCPTRYLLLPISCSFTCLFHRPLCPSLSCLPSQSPLSSRSSTESCHCSAPAGSCQLLQWANTSLRPGAGRTRHRWAREHAPFRHSGGGALPCVCGLEGRCELSGTKFILPGAGRRGCDASGTEWAAGLQATCWGPSWSSRGRAHWMGMGGGVFMPRLRGLTRVPLHGLLGVP